MMRRLLILVFAVAVAVMGVGVYVIGVNRTDGSTPTFSDLSSVNLWQTRIAEIGGSQAYEEMATLVLQASDSSSDQHLVAHKFGIALYRELGLDGAGVCDNRFSSGCLHEFVGHAMAEHGFKVLELLRDACIEVNGFPCLHSLGHGIVATLGYEVPDVSQALSICEDLSPEGWRYDCGRGVFMEFNVRTILGLQAESRPLGNGYFDPCPQFQGGKFDACVYALPQWWRTLLVGKDVLVEGGVDPDPSIFQELGSRCASPGGRASDVCYAGIGAVAAIDVGSSPEQREELCDALPEEGRSLCKTHAAYWWQRVRLNTKDTSTLTVMCEDLSSVERTRCEGAAAAGAAFPQI